MNQTRRRRLARLIAVAPFIQQGSKMPPELMSWWQTQDGLLKQGKNALESVVQFIDNNAKAVKHEADAEHLGSMRDRAVKTHDGISNVSMNIPGVMEAVYPQYSRPDSDDYDYTRPDQSQVETYIPTQQKTPKSQLTPSQIEEAQQPTEIRKPKVIYR